MININYKDSRPIYLQIKDEIKKLMISGAIKPDDRLMSVREMAVMNSINPNTIARAYRELESEGYIYSVAGKGSFATNVAELTTEHKNILFEEFKRVTRELISLDFDITVLKDFIDKEKGGIIDDRSQATI